ncbi:MULTISPECIES: helix-turn-helix domain-containing protein [Flavobacterium]|uniref:helix-turn-helix domain-containing protein n=1 Tax=Flavobacterium TaxID=237 RepID=UPI002114AD96|nr:MULTISPECIES: helix-turn-helix domain-containing protein [Flavobacterium]UUF13550.1 helix-turn-helix domain-containing protein [Flavobacterium panici]
MKKIPIYNQSPEAVGGIFIAYHSADDLANFDAKLEAHRDDFFIFFVLTKGHAILKCDMIDIEIKAINVLMIKPLQIHHGQDGSIDAAGYYIGVAPFLIPNNCIEIFQNLKTSEQLNTINTEYKEELLDTIDLLHRSFKSKNKNKPQIINGLFNALIYHFANIYSGSQNPVKEIKNQSAVIYADFKKLISDHTFLKSPSYFAKKLNITTSHLNDCVNASSGKSVTYWLQNAMITEAQRLLYYTDNEVKEIAFALGFEDHTYFSRLFKKITKETPLAFRKKFRE